MKRVKLDMIRLTDLMQTKAAVDDRLLIRDVQSHNIPLGLPFSASMIYSFPEMPHTLLR